MQNKVVVPAPMIREYKIGNTTYLVKSHSKPEAKEDAITKMNRLIQREVKKSFVC